MYLDFFGMKQAPFQLTPDVDCLYLSHQHAKAMVYRIMLHGILEAL